VPPVSHFVRLPLLWHGWVEHGRLHGGQLVLETHLWLHGVLSARRSHQQQLADAISRHIVQQMPSLFLFKVGALVLLDKCGPPDVSLRAQHVRSHRCLFNEACPCCVSLVCRCVLPQRIRAVLAPFVRVWKRRRKAVRVWQDTCWW